LYRLGRKQFPHGETDIGAPSPGTGYKVIHDAAGESIYSTPEHDLPNQDGPQGTGSASSVAS